MPVDNVDPLEPMLDPLNGGQMGNTYEEGYDYDDGAVDDPDEIETFSDTEILAYVRESRRQARNYQQVSIQQNWEEAEAAFRSKHHSRSKYLGNSYKNRSKYFKPKTRHAALKQQLIATAALFSSADVISTSANDESNPIERANAQLQKELLKYRIGNKSRQHGLPLFMTTLGARLQVTNMGGCVSKQTWSYKTKKRYVEEEITRPVSDAAGIPVIDFLTGEPAMETVIEEREIIDIVEDKPVCELIALENVLFSPNANWMDPINSSPYLIISHPMFADDVLAMTRGDNPRDATQWRDISDIDLGQGLFSDEELQGLKAAREGSDQAAQDNLNGKNASALDGQSMLTGQILDVLEVLFRVGGTDYHCWTLRGKVMLSDVSPVEDIYPAFHGERPLVFGRDLIDPFVMYAESDAYSWQQSQQEINELANLSIDAARKAVYPMIKVRAGSKVNHRSLQRQDASQLIHVREQDDVVFDKMPGANPSIYEEVNRLSADFDDVAGTFSGSSVHNNRQLNETVGGMAMISGNANSLSEFKLAVFVETWFEPVIAQIIALNQYYEDDATVLAVCGEKAQLRTKYGIDRITDELLEAQANVSVNVGLGSADPIAKLGRFNTVWQVASPILALGNAQGAIKLDYEALLDEIFTHGGFKNGADRFVKINDQEQAQVPMGQVQQAMQMMEAQMMQLKQENERLQSKSQEKITLKEMDIADRERAREFEMVMKSQGFKEDRLHQNKDHSHDESMARLEHMLDLSALPPADALMRQPF